MLQVLNEMMMANTSTSNCGLQPPPSLISTPSLYVSSPSGKWTFDLAFISYSSESSSSIFPQKHLGHSLLSRKQWKVKVKSLIGVRLFATPWTIAYHAPPSVGFSRQECWSGLPFPSPGDLPDPGIEPRSPELQVDTLPSEPAGKLLENGEWGYKATILVSLMSVV